MANRDANINRLMSKYGKTNNVDTVYKHWDRLSSGVITKKLSTRYKIKKIRRKPKKRTQHTKIKKWWVYVLELEYGRFYVGITGNVERRFKLHVKGGQALFTTQFKPLRIYSKRYIGEMSQSEASMVENIEAEMLAQEKGRDLVAGGSASLYHVITKYKQPPI